MATRKDSNSTPATQNPDSNGKADKKADKSPVTKKIEVMMDSNKWLNKSLIYILIGILFWKSLL